MCILLCIKTITCNLHLYLSVLPLTIYGFLTNLLHCLVTCILQHQSWKLHWLKHHWGDNVSVMYTYRHNIGSAEMQETFFFLFFSSSVGNCKYNNSFMYMQKQIYIHFLYIYNCQGCLYVLRANPFANHIYLRSMRRNRLRNLPFDDEVVKFTFLLVLLRKLFLGLLRKSIWCMSKWGWFDTLLKHFA